MTLTVTKTPLDGVLLLQPGIFADSRGYVFESFNGRDFESATGRSLCLAQENQSRSARGVLRGLHYQVGRAQAKLVRVLAGEIFDVAVDIRRSSPSFGKWFGAQLSDENRMQMWIPEGFAHGFVVTSQTADVFYAMTERWSPEHEHNIAWNDPSLGINWPVSSPVLSPKDASAPLLAGAVLFD